jgi:hypothetical protein
MAALACVRAEERPRSEPIGGALTPEPLLGTWVNTNATTRGITKAVLTPSGDDVALRIFGASDDGVPRDWGEVGARPFAENIGSTAATAFSAFYDFGFMETALQAHIRQGLLIIAKFERFKDDSDRSNYFTKEFFYHAR